VDKPLKSVWHGHCDTRPMVTFPAVDHQTIYTAWWQRCPLVKCRCADHQRVKRGPYFADQVRILLTCHGHRWSSFSVDYTCNSSVSVCPGEAIYSGIAQLAHTAGESIFCRRVWQHGSSEKTLGMTCCQRWRISHSHNDNISETMLDRDVVTGHFTASDTRIWPIQQQQL